MGFDDSKVDFQVDHLWANSELDKKPLIVATLDPFWGVKLLDSIPLALASILDIVPVTHSPRWSPVSVYIEATSDPC
jgi:hypothetical protein